MHLFQAISCHYASSDCYYIDVKGTTQEIISNEVKELAAKKYGVDDTVTFQVCSQLQINAELLACTCVVYHCSRVQHTCVCSLCRTLGLFGDVWSEETEHQCDRQCSSNCLERGCLTTGIINSRQMIVNYLTISLKTHNYPFTKSTNFGHQVACWE